MATARGAKASTEELACLRAELAGHQAALRVADKALREARASEREARVKAAAARKEARDAVARARSASAKARGASSRSKLSRAKKEALAASAKARAALEAAASWAKHAASKRLSAERARSRRADDVARVKRLIESERRRLVRVAKKEADREAYRALLERQLEQQKQTPPSQQQKPLPPLGPRRYTPEDERLVSEQAEAWMRAFLEPCAARNLGAAHVYRYCDSHEVDGQVRITLPLVPDLPIDEDPEDHPGAPLTFAEPHSVVHSFSLCLQRNPDRIAPFLHETFYQVGWRIAWPGGRKIDSKGDIQLLPGEGGEPGQAVEVYVIGSYWFKGDFPLALEIASSMLRNGEGRGFLDANDEAGAPVFIEFFFNAHWTPREERPPRIPPHMDLWTELLHEEV